MSATVVPAVKDDALVMVPPPGLFMEDYWNGGSPAALPMADYRASGSSVPRGVYETHAWYDTLYMQDLTPIIAGYSDYDENGAGLTDRIYFRLYGLTKSIITLPALYDGTGTLYKYRNQSPDTPISASTGSDISGLIYTVKTCTIYIGVVSYGSLTPSWVSVDAIEQPGLDGFSTIGTEYTARPEACTVAMIDRYTQYGVPRRPFTLPYSPYTDTGMRYSVKTTKGSPKYYYDPATLAAYTGDIDRFYDTSSGGFYSAGIKLGTVAPLVEDFSQIGMLVGGYNTLHTSVGDAVISACGCGGFSVGGHFGGTVSLYGYQHNPAGVWSNEWVDGFGNSYLQSPNGLSCKAQITGVISVCPDVNSTYELSPVSSSYRPSRLMMASVMMPTVVEYGEKVIARHA